MLVKFAVKLSLLLTLVFTPFTLLFAEDGSGIADPDVEVPIDGGVVFLLAAGVGYGIKMAHSSKKKQGVDPHLSID